MNVVSVHNASGKRTQESIQIEKILLRSLHKLKLSRVQVAVSFVSDSEMKKLNFKFRKKNKTTDVLSFSEDDLFYDKKKFLGDIIISKSMAAKQAKKAGHSLKMECAFLAVHGLLHLLGYDHERKKDEIIMFGLQHELLEHTKKI